MENFHASDIKKLILIFINNTFNKSYINLRWNIIYIYLD